MSVTDALQREFIHEYLIALDCPRALTVWLLFCSQEHKQLAQLSWDPHHYSDVVAARDSLAATKFLAKSTFLKTGFNLREEALTKFYAAELQCKESNKRIIAERYESIATPRVLLKARLLIEQWLTDFDADELIDACNWGPGATTKVKRRYATSPNKFQFETGITKGAFDLVGTWFSAAYPLWACDFTVVHANKVITVPKDAKTDRTIAIEPGINLWFQKGIGTMIRRRLSRIGVDLNKQERNQKLSRLASQHNTWATVDFSMASDTIPKELVGILLPPRWYHLLEAFRSTCGQLDGKILYYEKFSSMGNGFTFELESLIFYALAKALCQMRGDKGAISIYGDDLILPASACDSYTIIMRDLGFTVNQSKSYADSYYRESCGAHWWNGVNIKPIYQKEPINDQTSVLKAANAVRRQAHRRNSYGCDASLRRCWLILASALGDKFPRVSEGYGDVGIVENLDDPRVKVTKARHGIEGYRVRVWTTAAVKYQPDGIGLHLFKLKQIGCKEDFDPLKIPDAGTAGNDIPLPGRVRVCSIRLLVPRWYDLGPWC